MASDLLSPPFRPRRALARSKSLWRAIALLTLGADPAFAQEKPTLVIGGEDDRVVQLGSAPTVVLTPRHILLVEGKVPFVRVLRRDGGLLQSFGRSGGGPGEFSRSFKAAFDATTQRLVVFDYANSRLSYYSLQDSLVFERSSVSEVAPFTGCMVAGVPWQSANDHVLLRQLVPAGARLRPGRAVGTVKWFDPVTRNPAIARFTGQGMLACDPERRLAVMAPSGIGEAHLVSLETGAQHHLRLDDFRPMKIEPQGLHMTMLIPADGIYDLTEGVLATPQGLEIVVGRHTPWVKGREDVISYRRIAIAADGTQRIVAQSRWRPLAVGSDGAYCFAEEPAPTLARFASGRCP
jgi:hypothetical protein